jgi:phosphohistidine phosphatase
MIELLVVRHAIAFERDASRWRDDRKRPLTPEGRRRFRRAAEGLARLVEQPARVLTSPLVRAVETAQILANAIGWPKAVECAELAPQCTPARTLERLRTEQAERLAIVGHEPHLSRFVGACIAGSGARLDLEMKKGGVACLRFEKDLKAGGATLLMLLPPRVLRRSR